MDPPTGKRQAKNIGKIKERFGLKFNVMTQSSTTAAYKTCSSRNA